MQNLRKKKVLPVRLLLKQKKKSSPIEYVLTYWGRNLVYILEEMINKGLIKHPSQWDERFRWIGSEVIAMIDASIRNGGEKKGWFKKINGYAEAVYDIYQKAKPRLEISKDVGKYISSMPVGPAETKMLPEHGRFPLLLESMRLISFSVPNSDVYTLSGLGQAVQKTVQTMAPSLETVINEDYMYALLKVLDHGIEGLTQQEAETLEELGFIDSKGNLLPAGEHLLEVYKLWNERAYRPVKTFNLETLDEEILIGIEKVWDKNKTNPETVPTAEEIVHYLMEKMGRTVYYTRPF